MSASKRFTTAVWRAFQQNKGHDANSFGHMRVVDATPGKVWAEMKVERHQVNRLQGLHGGLIASLVDTMGSLALASRGLFMTGVGSSFPKLPSLGYFLQFVVHDLLSTCHWMGAQVSTDITITYVRGAALDDVVQIRSELVNMGKTLAYTRTELSSAKTGKLLAYGSHTKYIADALKSPKNVKFSEDGESIVEGEEPKDV
ncbi:hypothetical protein JCM11251_007491 [Rhodosporidiobolus azoricus]